MHTGVSSPAELSSDVWFARLDQQPVSSGAADWRVHVVGVYVSDVEVWVQLVRSDDPDDTIVLHLQRGATAQDAIAALTALPDSGQHPRVIEVARPDDTVNGT